MDLNKGTPDRRGKIPRSQVLGIKEFEVEDLITRLSKGYLDKELNEKALDFRFLSMITGKQLKVSGPGSATLEERAEEIEVQQFSGKLKGETELYIMYKRQLQISQAQTRRQKCDNYWSDRDHLLDQTTHQWRQGEPGDSPNRPPAAGVSRFQVRCPRSSGRAPVGSRSRALGPQSWISQRRQS